MEPVKLCCPNLTRTISVTGNECALSCAHCGRHYLRFMETPGEVRSRGPRQYKSALVSGGMNETGWVPVEKSVDFFTMLKEWGWRLNFHVGLLPVELMPSIKPVADRISFDYVIDDRTIREVYGLEARGEDFHRTYRALCREFHVIPHITVGLLGGKIAGEREALSSLREFCPEEIVFLIFRPTRNTEYSCSSPPSPGDVDSVFACARELFPEARFSLGCMRPHGEYGFQVEKLALENGFTTFVLPSRSFRDQVTESGYTIVDSWECCVL